MKYIDAKKMIEKIKYKRDHCDPNMKRRAGYDSAIAMIEQEQHGKIVKDVVSNFQTKVNECATFMVLYGEELLVIPKLKYLAAIKELQREEEQSYKPLEEVEE